MLQHKVILSHFHLQRYCFFLGGATFFDDFFNLQEVKRDFVSCTKLILVLYASAPALAQRKKREQLLRATLSMCLLCVSDERKCFLEENNFLGNQ